MHEKPMDPSCVKSHTRFAISSVNGICLSGDLGGAAELVLWVHKISSQRVAHRLAKVLEIKLMVIPVVAFRGCT